MPICVYFTICEMYVRTCMCIEYLYNGMYIVHVYVCMNAHVCMNVPAEYSVGIFCTCVCVCMHVRPYARLLVQIFVQIGKQLAHLKIVFYSPKSKIYFWKHVYGPVSGCSGDRSRIHSLNLFSNVYSIC